MEGRCCLSDAALDWVVLVLCTLLQTLHGPSARKFTLFSSVLANCSGAWSCTLTCTCVNLGSLLSNLDSGDEFQQVVLSAAVHQDIWGHHWSLEGVLWTNVFNHCSSRGSVDLMCSKIDFVLSLACPVAA